MAAIALCATAPIGAGCTPVQSSVLVNELTWQAGGKVELAGTTANAVDLSGWTLRRAEGGLGFTFAGGVTLAPGQHLVLTQQTDQTFVLNKSDTLILEDQTGLLLDQVVYGSDEAELSYCRIPDAEGPFQPCARSTFGEENQP